MDDRRTNYEAPKEFTEKDLRLVGQLQRSCVQHSAITGFAGGGQLRNQKQY